MQGMRSLQKNLEIGKRQRPAEQIALVGVAALCCQSVALFDTLDALGDHLQTEAAGQSNDGSTRLPTTHPSLK
jgi:hypothetical protein